VCVKNLRRDYSQEAQEEKEGAPGGARFFFTLAVSEIIGHIILIDHILLKRRQALPLFPLLPPVNDAFVDYYNRYRVKFSSMYCMIPFKSHIFALSFPRKSGARWQQQKN
jgi:hypothetical protein